MSYSLPTFSTYYQQNIFTSSSCYILACVFLNILSSSNGIAINYINQYGTCKIQYSLFNSCKASKSSLYGGTFYLKCLKIDNYGNTISLCQTYDSSSGYSQSEDINFHHCYSISSCSGTYRSFYSIDGFVKQSGFNFSYMKLSDGSMSRADPKYLCDLRYLNFIHNRPNNELSIEGSFTSNHYLDHVNIYNCSNSGGNCIRVNTKGLVEMYFIYASNYKPIPGISPKVYFSKLEQTSISSIYNGGNNLFGVKITHIDLIKTCIFETKKILPTKTLLMSKKKKTKIDNFLFSLLLLTN